MELLSELRREDEQCRWIKQLSTAKRNASRTTVLKHRTSPAVTMAAVTGAVRTGNTSSGINTLMKKSSTERRNGGNE